VERPIFEHSFKSLQETFTVTYPDESQLNLVFGTPNRPIMFSGIVPKVARWLSDHRYPITIHREYKGTGYKCGQLDSILEGFQPSLTPREYQRKAVDILLQTARGSVELATGSGKTLVIAMLLHCLQRLGTKRFLVIVDTLELLAQLRADLGGFLGQQIGEISRGCFEMQSVVVASVQTLYRHTEALKTVQCIIVDEAHLVGAPKFFDSVVKSKAHLRYGFSGTYTRSIKQERILLDAATGPKLMEYTTSQLVTDGFAPKPIVTIVKLRAPRDWHRSLPLPILQRIFIQGNKVLNRLAVAFARYHYRQDHQVLLFVKLVNHGSNLTESLGSHGIPQEDIAFVNGSVPKLKRLKILDDFRKGHLRVVVSTNVWMKGINVPAVDAVINLTGEASTIGCRQRTGRGLRLGGMSDNFYLYDFYHRGPRALECASQKRCNEYLSEPAFQVDYISEKDAWARFDLPREKYKDITTAERPHVGDGRVPLPANPRLEL